MDAVKFLNELCRMHDTFNVDNDTHRKCPLYSIGCMNGGWHIEENHSKMVEAVEKWSKEHPIKTRQSEFLKNYPRARLDEGILDICPASIESMFDCKSHDYLCTQCHKEFWLKEIE